jgi:hypothetical protein
VLIDYVASDLAILALASEHIGRVHVLEQTLATVENLSERECKKQDIEVIDVDTRVLVEAGAKSGPLSFEDWLCLIVCRERAWSCVTNDRALRRVCRKAGIRVRRGLGLMVDLVRSGAISEKRALLVARAIHEHNPHHINDGVLRAFHRAIGAEEASSSPIPPTP